MTRWIAAAALLTISLPALADDDKKEPRVVYPEVSVVDFEGAKVKGDLVKPGVQLVNTHTGLKFESLAKGRVDFKPEMKVSVDEIK